MDRTLAVITGVGPGLGAALARRFAAEGCSVGLLARSGERLARLEGELCAAGHQARGIATDIAEPDQVVAAFASLRELFGPVGILINHASAARWQGLLDLSAADFERAWRVCALGSFLCAQQAVPDMLRAGRGTLLFTGATSAVRGRGGAVDFSAAKFAVRGMAQSLARELGPAGIHVAHVVIDGQIDTPRLRLSQPQRDATTLLQPDAIAGQYWQLARQPRDCWTLELDLRPHCESF